MIIPVVIKIEAAPMSTLIRVNPKAIKRVEIKFIIVPICKMGFLPNLLVTKGKKRQNIIISKLITIGNISFSWGYILVVICTPKTTTAATPENYSNTPR
jgi:hypothetical protein